MSFLSQRFLRAQTKDFHSYYSFLYLSYGQFYAVMYFKILLIIQIDYHLGTDLSNPEGFCIQYQVILHFIGLLKYYFRNFMNFSGRLIYSYYIMKLSIV